MGLMACSTLGQLFIHLTTLDNSIVWSKSIMNTKCKICRRKQDPDKMLLCDGCDNAYQIYCLKPKLKSIPEGDWFCPECKPKERVRSPRKKVRKSFSFHEEEASDEEEDEKTSKKKNSTKNKKRVVESEEEEEEKKETPPKKKSGGRRKIIESEDITWGDGEKIGADMLEEEGGNMIKQLAVAIIQVGQMISEQDRYLKQPLGEDEKEKKKRLKKEEEARKKREEAQEDEDEEDEVEVKVVMTPYKKWEKSLMACPTLGQLFIHLTTLDNSIVWSKSIMNTKCKICRRKQ